MNRNTRSEEFEIDLLQLGRSLWRHLWLILAFAVLGGAAGFLTASFIIHPKYQASIQVYVNNSNQTNTTGMISTTEITAAKNLVDTYVVILESRSTMEAVQQKAALPYSTGTLSRMISASAVDETQIFRVSVTSENPYEAQLIANTVAEVLPGRIAEIVDGSSVRIIDSAVLPRSPVSPNVMKYTVLFAALGFFCVCLVVCIREILDDVIHDENDLYRAYPGTPVLGVIPNLAERPKDGHYSSYKDYGHTAREEEKA